MSESGVNWYSYYNEIKNKLDDDVSYDNILSSILSGQNTFSLNKKKMQRSVDITWVEAIEDALIHLDNVIRSPRKTIEDVESVVPIALSRKITVESVKHLAQHTNLIQDYDPSTGKVTPSKVLNVYKEESMMTYENKFINTLINKLYIFINRRYDKLKEVRSDEAVTSLEYNSQISEAGGKMNIALKLEAVDSLETVDESGSTVWDRIERIKRTVVSYKGSPFCTHMGSAYIRPPVIITVQFEYCFDYRKSETRTHNFTLVIFRAVVLIENELYLLLLDTVTRIFHLDKHSVRLIYLSDVNLLIISRVVYGIVNKVVDDLLYLHNIAANRPLLIGSEVDIVTHSLGNALETVDYLAQLSPYAKACRFEFLPSAFKLGKVKNIVYHCGESVGLVDDYFEVLVSLHRIIPR